MDPRALARYPFLPQASRYAAENGPSLDDILADAVFGSLRGRGRDRLLAAVDEAELPATEPPTDETELLFDLLTYPVGRMLVAACADPYVTRRHALAEAVRVRHFLEREPNASIVVSVAGELGIGAETGDPTADGEPTFRVHVTDFVRLASVLKDTPWKLVNQPLSRGVVTLTRTKLARLCQEALRRRLERVPDAPPEVEEALASERRAVVDAARVRKEKYQAEGFGPMDLESFPPCMKQILGMLQAGENAPHSARFAITSFLHVIGLDADEIIGLFAQAPDFREDLTRYQVEHITGRSSGGTEYKPPGCQAMMTYGICYQPDKWCTMTNRDGERYVTHPLSYYRWALKRKAPEEPRPRAGPTDDAEPVPAAAAAEAAPDPE